ncbi:hypothetical protein KFL_000090370 [Klebsormidium nitens]|uniref:Uncharacterized protein n=1 Tax=Klebsormidium nitens TaxID=105231 RepID=A0A1Y1HMG4_KLENI|nr:hypothetical protein KFL_000090370 [Klebsormidium nitens]|eukprot:GAQ78191.1 hypothetical protein KFL_000090370 [Klebsormidium nitens]
MHTKQTQVQKRRIRIDWFSNGTKQREEGAVYVEIGGVPKWRFFPLLEQSPLTFSDVDVSTLVDFSLRRVKLEAVLQFVQQRLNKKHLALSSNSLQHYASTSGKDPSKKVRATHGNTPDWYALFACTGPGCGTKLLVGGFFSQPPEPAKGQSRQPPTGLDPRVYVWGSPTPFERKKTGKGGSFLSGHVLHCLCEHTLDKKGLSAAYGRLSGEARLNARAAANRPAHNDLLSAASPGKVAVGNFSGAVRTRAVINQLRWEQRRAERPWGSDQYAGLRMVKEELRDQERSKIPRSVDLSNRVLCIVQTTKEDPLSGVLLTESMLIKYRALHRNGFGADFTAGIIKKTLVKLANGDTAIKQILVFAIVAVNPYSGEKN